MQNEKSKLAENTIKREKQSIMIMEYYVIFILGLNI